MHLSVCFCRYTEIVSGRKAGVHAIQRLVPDKYKMRLRDVNIDLDKVDKSVHLHPDTVLLKEPGLYCFLLRCGRNEPFMEWVVETVLPREVHKLAGIVFVTEPSLEARCSHEIYAHKCQLIKWFASGELGVNVQYASVGILKTRFEL